MPEYGDEVTVRALVNLPTVEQGGVQVLRWGPHLERLVQRERYALLDPPPRRDEPTAPPPRDQNTPAEPPAGAKDRAVPAGESEPSGSAQPRRPRSR